MSKPWRLNREPPAYEHIRRILSNAKAPLSAVQISIQSNYSLLTIKRTLTQMAQEHPPLVQSTREGNLVLWSTRKVNPGLALTQHHTLSNIRPELAR